METNSFYISLAQKNFLITSKLENNPMLFVLHEKLKSFLANDNKVFLNVSILYLDDFAKKYKEEKKCYDQIILQLLKDTLKQSDRILLHSGCVYKANKGYLFIGPSNSGKTTVVKLLQKKGYNILSDDKVIIKKEKNRYTLFSVPPFSYETERFFSNPNFLIYLDKIFFIKKSNTTYFKKISIPKAVAYIFGSAKNFKALYPSKIDIKKIFNFVITLANRINCYSMHFRKDLSFYEKLVQLL